MWKLSAFKITNQKKSFDFEKDFGNLNKIFHFNVYLTQGITKYYKNVLCLFSNSSYDERMFLWIICDLELIHNYTNHILYLLLQLKWRRNINEYLICLNLIPEKFTPFYHQFVVILLMLLRSQGEVSTFSLYFQIII